MMNTPHPKPAYSSRNPKLDFYGHDGSYLYSSNWYKSIKHARQFADPTQIKNIKRATK